MKLQLTQAQMNERWLTLRRLNTVPLDAVVTRHDGIDMAQLVAEETRKWYFNLLLSAPEVLLAPHDIEDAITLHADGKGGARILLPQGVVRVLSVEMRGWSRPARLMHDNIYPEEAVRRARRRQMSPLTAATPDAPVAFLHSNELRIYPYDPSDELRTLRVVTMTDDLYEFDSMALSSILNLENPYDFTV